MSDLRSASRDRTHPQGDWNHRVLETPEASLHYVDEGSGPPLLLFHGWPEFWWTWHRNIGALERSWRVIAPDLRGFGQSRIKPPHDFLPAGADVHARDILALADALGLERFGIVSHDVGAYVAQTLARQHPERLSGLFFFNAPYPGIGRRWADASHLREIWYQSFQQQPWAAQLVGHSRETCRIYFEGILRHWAHVQTAFDGQIDHWTDNFMRPGNIEGGFAWYAATHAARMDLVANGAPSLPAITVPSRFFWGQEDPVIRVQWMDRLADYFKNPVLETAEGAGHFVHLEAPDAANLRIADFFTQLDFTDD
ncbi:alpha/beta fold hydrolase [Rhodoferax sp.]|uniref:alpha/beta fold hydrolase n=1 Tax=Rhodoferax sp. TaxID=50421 RepID=UPI003784EB48